MECLSRAGELAVNDLAANLDVSPSAIRQHMVRLIDDGLVTFREVGHGKRGRPRRMFALTRLGNRLLPAVSDDLALTLFYQMMETKPELVLPVLRAHMLDTARATLAALPEDIEGKKGLAGLVGALNRADFQAICEHGEEDGEFVLTLGHCPALSLAHALEAVCATELETFHMFLPGATIERDLHRLDGDRFCRFRIRLPAEVLSGYVRAS